MIRSLFDDYALDRLLDPENTSGHESFFSLMARFEKKILFNTITCGLAQSSYSATAVKSY